MSVAKKNQIANKDSRNVLETKINQAKNNLA
jgi:hypothetical protein